MIRIHIEEDCYECEAAGSVRATVQIDKEHGKPVDRERLAFTSYWNHLGFQADDCVRVRCKECGVIHTVDVGPFEFHVHPGTEPAANIDYRFPAWVPEYSGRIIEENEGEG